MVVRIDVLQIHQYPQEISVVVDGVCNHFDRELEHDGEAYEVCNKCGAYREIITDGEDTAYIGEWHENS